MHINVLRLALGKDEGIMLCLFSSVYPAVGVKGTKQEMPWWFGILCLGLMQPV